MPYSTVKIKNSIVLILSFFLLSACEQQNTHTQTDNNKKETVTIKDNTNTENRNKPEEPEKDQVTPEEQTKIKEKQENATNINITASMAKEILIKKFGTLDENKVTYTLLPSVSSTKNKINNKPGTDYYTFMPQFDNHRADFTFSVHKQTGEIIVNWSDGSTLTEAEFKNTQKAQQVNQQTDKPINKPVDITKFTSEDAIKILEKRMGPQTAQLHYGATNEPIGIINGIKLYDVFYARGEGERQRVYNFAVGSDGNIYNWYEAQKGVLTIN
ncbi:MULTISPECIES: hypothetical protein [Bacillus]|uniref:Lipoprotein n=2 Tax=Bacillus cereus group TaxID=86661 RepID=A0A2B0XM20_BACAN|nr:MULTISPECIES: hypothetical protein [Bacillus]KZD34429.1 Thymidylate synthase thyX [Bacillus cereus]MBJ8057401.1 hypothetical protein [Bacillus cereus]MCU4755170.1 hypothetical protein [Bacillus cereus]MCU5104860.1 hypothetical protein [Bacillus cereus]MCU5338914.1 hypothetical protein [Bacillus cereus]